jgi:hypothetical protein
LANEIADARLILRAQHDAAGVILRIVGVLLAAAALPRRLRALLALPCLRGPRAWLLILLARLLVRSLWLAVAPLGLPACCWRVPLVCALLRFCLPALPVARLAFVLTGGGRGIAWGILLIPGALLGLSVLLALVVSALPLLRALPVLSTLLALDTSLVLVVSALLILRTLLFLSALVARALSALSALCAFRCALLVLRTLPVAALLRRRAQRLIRSLRLLIALHLINLPSLIGIAALINILRAGCGHAECKRDCRGTGQIMYPHGGSLLLSRLLSSASRLRLLLCGSLDPRPFPDRTRDRPGSTYEPALCSAERGAQAHARVSARPNK